MNDLKDYLWEKREVLGLFVLYLLLGGIVYRLYQLSWGPALYTGILVSVCTCLQLLTGYVRYRKKREGLEHLLKQEEIQVEQGIFPKPEGAVEGLYQELLKKEEKKVRTEKELGRERLLHDRAYYTRWSHQIKTPIAAMELLLSETPPDVRALKRELLKTGQYIEMALNYQKMEGKEKDLVIRPCSLREMVGEAVKKVGPLLIYKKIRVELGALEQEVLTDEKWFLFILEQLLTNAAKYTGEGGTVTIGLDREGRLLLSDNGIGICPEDLPRVFEWGYTGNNGRLDKKATGIGLSLVKSAAEMLGHSVEITSRPGEGTCVTLALQRQELEIE